MEKRYLPFDDENWDAIVEEAFSPDAEIHVFSERYKSRKARLMRKYSENEKRPVIRRKTFIAIAAAAAALAAVPTSVYAGTRIYNAYMEKPAEYQRDITIDAGESPSMDIKALNVGWVPEDMVMQAGEEHTCIMKYHSTDDNSRGISVMFWKIPTGDENFKTSIGSVADSTSYTDINGNSIIILNHSQDWQEQRQEVWVAFKDTPYAAQVYIMGDVSESERVQILENLTLESWDSEVALDWTEEQERTEPADVSVLEDRENLADGKVVQIGESFSYGYDVEASEFYSDKDGHYSTDIVINDIRIQDNFDGITTDAFNAPFDYSQYTHPDGTVVDNVRTWIRMGDGIDTVDEIIKKENVPQSVVVMDVTYTNTGDVDWYECICPSVMTADENGDLYMYLDTEEGVSYSDSLLELKCDNMMFSISTDHVMAKNSIDPFKPGETANVKIAFLVDTADLSETYIRMGLTGDEAVYVDVASIVK